MLLSPSSLAAATMITTRIVNEINMSISAEPATPEFDKHAQIYLENILDKNHPLWQAGARYQATYAYVLSPLTDEIRLVPSNHACFLFKNILTESEMAHVQQSMKQGETS